VAREVSLLHYVQTGSGADPPSYVFPGVKWQGREVDHSRSSSAEFKNVGTMPPLSQIFTAW
jgi:hypothetical protein